MNKELIQKRFQSARRWTTVLLVFLILGTLSSLVSLPGTLKPDRQTYESIDNLQVYNFINHPLYKVYAILLIALNFFLIVKFFQNRKLLIGQKLCPKYPYYLNTAKIVLTNVVSFLFVSTNLSFASVGQDAQTQQVVSTTMTVMKVFGLVVMLLYVAMNVLVIVRLFQLEGNNDEGVSA
ncbi:MAG: hypothetical protein LKJ03_06750 [Enterococcaceae bacterium]|jgi:protein-S-isoprenylcysteine O-methyltransferase Ste14|nr:hypothetical protein [Enterococcaceae bacterium]MCI1919793.1 hypothetical protein [Enterococcaceae bacterium]